ncbi:hypothetical protein ES692_04720 [Psychroserpens burtonensis]|uniref:Uncharacterized protein n=1 Tax=Psychroserpens burtonensis TaxID=49278 RepID=A0A5C7BJ63_9FLAO|nr:DUF6090 family protein [Psychroserpens burtonensis]TXE19160.1 hypothetical protein ES692_04720 [Psychroserpens burtonensis]
MIKFFRRIRYDLIEKNKTGKYFKYAVGEIVLVVIGILIALSINNWNEERKKKGFMITNIKSISEDIKADLYDIKKVNKTLYNQIVAANNIIPIMESENRFIIDSLKFIMDFNSFTTTPIISERSNTWSFINSSGVVSEFPDSKLLKLLQDYYKNYNDIVINFTNSGNPAKLELRKLKYELFSDTEHRKFFPTNSPKAPSSKVYNSIFEDKRILPLCRFIGSTANYFEKSFNSVQDKGETVLDYINEKYN